MDSAGAGIWIAIPLLVGIVMGLTDPSLRRSYLASWKPGRFRAYGVALVVFPLSFVAAIAVGWAAGWLEPSGLGAFAGVVVAAAVGTLGKNVFEEGAWRGYLAPALVGRGLPDLWVWVISGTVWAVWHYPYYLFLFDESLTRAVWDVPPVVYATLGIVIVNLWAMTPGQKLPLSSRSSVNRGAHRFMITTPSVKKTTGGTSQTARTRDSSKKNR